MGGCSAINCNSHSRKQDKMFRFPADPVRRKLWIRNCRRDAWVPGPNAQLCSKHFEENQYEQNREDQWKKLKPNAVPTLFDVPNPPSNIGPMCLKGIGKTKERSLLHSQFSNVQQICDIQLKKSDFETEVSAYNPQTGVTITYPLLHKHLKKGVIPSVFLPAIDLTLSSEKLSKLKKQLETEAPNVVQNKVKCTYVNDPQLKDSSDTSLPSRTSENKKEESKEMVKRKRKSTNEPSSKKVDGSAKLNGTHTSNGVQTSEKATGVNSKKSDKPVCTNPEAFAFLNVLVKQEPLSDGEVPSGSSRNNPQEDISENMQITNVRSLSSERSIAGSPSAEDNEKKKTDEALDSNFYSKPLDMDQRDKAFGSFVACELSDLRVNPALYMKTKQSILKLLTEAHFEQMSSGNNS